MPLIHDPEDPKGGPGSAFLSTTLHSKVRRRRKKTSIKTAEMPLQEGLIGEDLLEWKDEQAADDDNTPAIKRSKKTCTSMEEKPPTSKKGDTRRIPTSHVSPPMTVMKTQPLAFAGTEISSNVRLPRVRHALAVDTRALETDEGMTTFQNVRQQIISFLSTLSKRGAAPCILGYSSMAQQQSLRSNKSPCVNRNACCVMKANAIHLSQSVATALERGIGGDLVDDLIGPVPIRPPLNANNKQNRKAVHVPKRLLAHDSWKLFGDLVEAVTREDAASKSTNSITAPLDVTILTNDVCFLCDTKQDCHKRGLNRFWERMRPLFEKNALRSVVIVIAQTGSVVLAGQLDIASQSEGDADNPELSSDKSELSPIHKQELAAVQCIQSIKSQLTRRSEDDFKKSRGSEDPLTVVTISLASIPNDHVGYHTLFQQWLSELLALARDKGRLAFEFPETIDGMQCSLSFEAAYKVFPFRADSIAAAGLMTDLQLLSQSTFEVLQLVPLSCIDASLIFGVPITVCAKLENDLVQYKEMKALVSCLFQYLIEKEVALLLRSADTSVTAPMDFGEPLYHVHGQTFLLMAEELPCRNLLAPSQSQPDGEGASQAKASGTRPSTGMLVRFASAEQLLDSGSSKVLGEDGDVESRKELSEYVENALDFLDSSALNPLIIAAMKASQYESVLETVPMEESGFVAETPWTDNDGVGARVRANSSDGLESLTNKSEDDGSMGDIWNAFSYP